MSYVPPPHGDPGTGLFPELKKKYVDPAEKTENILEKLWNALKSTVLFIWHGVESLFKLLIKTFTGDIVEIFGYAPYITLPALILIPFQVSFPGSVSFFLAPLKFVGVTDTAIYSYQFFGGFYWLLLTIYNFVQGDALSQA